MQTDTIERPAGTVDRDLRPAAAMAAYVKIADAANVSSPAITIEQFRGMLAEHDIPVFNRARVVAYMDSVARRENKTGLGWHWKPLRSIDGRPAMAWGRDSAMQPHPQSQGPHRDALHALGEPTHQREIERLRAQQSNAMRNMQAHMEAGWTGLPTSSHQRPQVLQAVPMSDFYVGDNRIPTYERAVPLHALTKAALIRERFGSQVCLLVSDYTTRSDFYIADPDPFLLAVIPNREVQHGVGQFVIDVWDEPGFGLADRLA